VNLSTTRSKIYRIAGERSAGTSVLVAWFVKSPSYYFSLAELELVASRTAAVVNKFS